jgi:NAD+ kinase
MKRIALIANCKKADAAAVMRRAQDCADRIGLELYTCEETCEILPQARRIAAEQISSTVDAVMALGGDGTLLNAVRILEQQSTPLIGVNLGNLGFMTSVPENLLEDALEALRNDATESSFRTMTDCRIESADCGSGDWTALNDIVIGWGGTSRIITADIRVNGEHALRSLCDGVIISTPTGSTGHSMSAGGPIVHPESSVFVISIVCPHTLSNRPLVIPDKFEIEIEIAASSKTLLLAVDGVDRCELRQGDCVKLRRSQRNLELLHLPEYSYFKILKQKLHWRGSVV